MTDISGDFEQELTQKLEQNFSQSLEETKSTLASQFNAKETELKQKLNKKTLECMNLRKTIEENNSIHSFEMESLMKEKDLIHNKHVEC